MDSRGAFIGSGKIYLADIATPEKLIYIGNCSSLTYEAEPQEITLPDYSTPGGGTDASINRIVAVNIAYTAHHFNKANIARALYATVTDKAAGTVEGEAHTAYKGALVKTAFPSPSTVVVKNQAGDTTYELDTDYIVNEAGIEIVEGGNIADAAAITIDYAYPPHADIQALTASNKKFRMVFKGLNEARTGKPQIIEVYKISHSPSSLGVIGDSFGEMPFSGKAEKDATKIGTGLSQYMQIQDVD
ncbi:hypothetical protein SAMN05216421_1110 [Halopseudomonas xinjiangensis]|uniref:Uncharacterized protein n=1 Tax=Halopseudomonas xinjiangensis TaxID=487184 RepID=A0A1H1QCU5_9GAMM|nr:hypothetical protein [Halopseudomonas xinjiangensis]SDS21328.1 hypothetical protein SAMN05216421_1110 [Halopseudomonas xinjiangensis]